MRMCGVECRLKPAARVNKRSCVHVRARVQFIHLLRCTGGGGMGIRTGGGDHILYTVLEINASATGAYGGPYRKRHAHLSLDIENRAHVCCQSRCSTLGVFRTYNRLDNNVMLDGRARTCRLECIRTRVVLIYDNVSVHKWPAYLSGRDKRHINTHTKRVISVCVRS